MWATSLLKGLSSNADNATPRYNAIIQEVQEYAVGFDRHASRYSEVWMCCVRAVAEINRSPRRPTNALITVRSA